MRPYGTLTFRVAATRPSPHVHALDGPVVAPDRHRGELDAVGQRGRKLASKRQELYPILEVIGLAHFRDQGEVFDALANGNA